MTEQEFRAKYPYSTEEQVQLYVAAVQADALAVKPPVEPDIPMPLITVPQPVEPVQVITTYAVPSSGYTLHNFSLADVPPEMPSAATDSAMREVMLGSFAAHLSPEQRARFQNQHMSADDMLAAFFDPKWTPGGLGSH